MEKIQNSEWVDVKVPVSVFRVIIDCAAKWGLTPTEWIEEIISSGIKSDMMDSPEACAKSAIQ